MRTESRRDLPGLSGATDPPQCVRLSVQRVAGGQLVSRALCSATSWRPQSAAAFSASIRWYSRCAPREGPPGQIGQLADESQCPTVVGGGLAVCARAAALCPARGA